MLSVNCLHELWEHHLLFILLSSFFHDSYQLHFPSYFSTENIDNWFRNEAKQFAVFIDNNKIKSLNRLRMIKLFDKKKVFGWSTTASNYFDDICFMLDTFARM